MQSLSSRRSRGSKWWPKNDLLATLRPSDPMKTAVPSHAHDSVNAATIVLATTAMPTEHQEGTRTRRSRGGLWARPRARGTTKTKTAAMPRAIPRLGSRCVRYGGSSPARRCSSRTVTRRARSSWRRTASSHSPTRGTSSRFTATSRTRWTTIGSRRTTRPRSRWRRSR